MAWSFYSGSQSSPISMRTVAAILSLWATSASALRLVQNFDFCVNERVQEIENNCSEPGPGRCIPGFDGLWKDSSGLVHVDIPTCEQLCGDGFAPIRLSALFMRATLWFVPIMILISKFHYPALPQTNHVLVVCHMLSDPVDAIWSMCLRVEAFNQYLTLISANGSTKAARAIATIWCAYDEIGFQNPSAHFFSQLQWIRRRGNNGDFFRDDTARTSHGDYSSADLTASIFDAGADVGGENTGGGTPESRCSMSKDGMLSYMGLNCNISVARVEDVSNEQVVEYLIERAAQDLIANRSNSTLSTWVAIGALIMSLTNACIRSFGTSSNGGDIGHSIVIVTLLFLTIPIVKLSGSIGAFTSSTAPLDVIQNLRRQLGSQYDLFPCFNFADKGVGRRSSSSSEFDDIRNLRLWPEMAASSGMNAPWRPFKWSRAGHGVIPSPRVWKWLFASAVLVFVFCFTPAMLISYWEGMPGFGCACLAWTLMGSTWVLSLGLDSMFHLLGFFRTAKTLWRATIIKDITLSALVLLLALTEQIGILNSCYCLSGAAGSNDHPSIELSFTVDRDPGTKKLWIATPVTALVLILGFILSLEFAYSDARTLLNRCQTEIEDNILKINMLRDLSKLKTG